jgi:hypothetical protein
MRMVNRIFYNYIYLDPTKPVNFKIKGLDIILKYEPFYVGKGKKNRLNDHKRGRSGPFMKAKMKSLNDKDIIPIVLKINPNISDYESKKNEKYLIKAIGRRDLGLGPLCNLTDGGDGTCNKVITEKARSHSGTFKKGHTPWLKDKKMCNETKNKLSVSNKGKPGPRKGIKVSEETKLKMSTSKLGIKRLQGVTEKINKSKLGFKNINTYKAVNQYNLQGDFIKAWDCITDVKFCKKSNISACCNNKRKTAGGFIWKFNIK